MVTKQHQIVPFIEKIYVNKVPNLITSANMTEDLGPVQGGATRHFSKLLRMLILPCIYLSRL